MRFACGLTGVTGFGLRRVSSTIDADARVATKGQTMAKKGRDSAKDLVATVFNGGLRAAKLFDKATGGCRLDEACEYLVTASIFERLAQRDRGYVFLEVPVKWAREEAGAVRCGRPSQADRMGGRYDLVHYWGNGKPRAAIEVKSSIRNVVRNSFHGDFNRLTTTLKASRDSSYQFTAFVFFATKDYSESVDGIKEKRKRAKAGLEKLMTGIENLATEYVAHPKNPLIRRLYTSSVQYSKDLDEGAWQLGMVLFADKWKATTFTKGLLDRA